MKSRIFKINLLALVVLLALNNPTIAATTIGANSTVKKSIDDDPNTQVKNYSKTYAVDGNDILKINNRYGKITVNTWTRNEVKVDVQIKVAARMQLIPKGYWTILPLAIARKVLLLHLLPI
jgi:hypothetical protein